MRIVLIIAVALAVVAGAGCGSSSEADAGAETSVVAGFYPLAYAAERVGGADLAVTNLTPAGSEPHDLELSARDVGLVRGADVVLFLGEEFQPAVERAAADAEGRVIDLLEGQRLLEGGEHGRDPHVWLDPTRYAGMARRIAGALPGGSAGALEADLRDLDRKLREGLADCERRTIVTSHAAFGYLAARYGLEQIALTGVSPEAEPTPRQLEELVDEVKRTGSTTVFFETLVSPRLAETVARETGAEARVLNPIEGLTPEEADQGEDYFSLMRANLATLREALGCR